MGEDHQFAGKVLFKMCKGKGQSPWLVVREGGKGYEVLEGMVPKGSDLE